LAVAKGDSEVVGWLLARKPDVNARDYWGAPPLFWVPDSGMTILRMLLAAGADVRATNPRDETALHRVTNGDLARALIAAGADIEARNSMGRTPLFETSSEDAALALLDAGARIDALPDGSNKLKEMARVHQWSRVMTRLRG
jgi:ankyrin repeat protein